MISLATGIDYVDLNFLGYPNIIATAVLHGPGGVALIDPGPSTCLTTLRSTLERSGIGMADVRQILLTHIHLDHAGCTGTLVKENPSIDVFVHERGATHLADPTKLVSSATRLYGQDMDRLWGEFLPVPRERLRELKGGETVEAGGRTLQVAYTPGHASHHVSYFEPSTRIAFVGDTAGIRRGTELGWSRRDVGRRPSDDSSHRCPTRAHRSRGTWPRATGHPLMPAIAQNPLAESATRQRQNRRALGNLWTVRRSVLSRGRRSC
jgi:glyoxylase-like metal-dependent hydrolase (beta-lactamase superfamily II)